jgi:hypothetical protein
MPTKLGLTIRINLFKKKKRPTPVSSVMNRKGLQNKQPLLLSVYMILKKPSCLESHLGLLSKSDKPYRSSLL